MSTKLTRLSSGTAPVLFSFMIFVLTLIGCGSPTETETPSPDSATTLDTAITPTDATNEIAVPTTDADDASRETTADTADSKSTCTQGDKCDEIGKPCESFVCTPCGWQNAMSDCDAGTPDADGSSDGDAPSDADAFDSVIVADSDADMPDTFVADATPDTPTPDTPTPDADATIDTMPDTSVAKDTATPDADASDTTKPDTFVADATPDTPTPDADAPDAPADSGVADTGPSDTGTDSDAETPPPDTAPKTLKFSKLVRDTAFDALKIFGGAIEDVGRGCAPSPTSVYVPVRNGGKATVVRWNGTSWIDEGIPGPPQGAAAVWCTGDDNVWLAAGTSTLGTLLYKKGGGWTIDSTQPTTSVISDITGHSATEMFIVGRKSTPDVLAVWKGTGSSWTELPALPSSDWFTPIQLYAPGDGKVVLGGYDIDESSFLDKQLALYIYNSTTWTKLLSPAGEDLVYGGGVHGTSINEIWVAGRTSGKVGKVCKVSSLTTWTCWTSASTSPVSVFGPVYTPWSGAALSAGQVDSVAPPGAGRFMMIDSTTVSPAAITIDTKSRGANAIWRAPGTKSYFMDHSGKPGEPAGFYRLTSD